MRTVIYERVLRRLLREGGGGDLTGLAAYVSDDGLTAIIYHYPTVVAHTPDNPDMSGKPIWGKSPVFFGTKVVKGLVRLQGPPAPCDDAYQTRFTVGPGLGKLVYGLGYALSPSGKLMASRERGGDGSAKVTDAAQGGWSKVYQKSGRVVRRLDDIELPQEQRLTPDDPSDDCELQPPKDQEGNPMNYSYRAEGWEQGALSALKSAHAQAMESIPPEFKGDFIGALEKGAEFFWTNNYPG